MTPCELNALIAALTNYLYCNLSKKDFLFLNVFFSELSKSMFSMEILRGISFFEEKHDCGHNEKPYNEHKKDETVDEKEK